MDHSCCVEAFFLRLRQSISSGCHHATPTPIFLNFHYCGRGALYFCFDLARVFLLGAIMPPLHPFFSELSLLWEGALCFCLDLAKVFPQGETTPRLHFFFVIVIIVGKGALCFCFDLAKVFLQGATMSSLNQIFFAIVIIVGRGHYASASPWARYYFRLPPRHPYTIFLNCHYCGKGHYASPST